MELSIHDGMLNVCCSGVVMAVSSVESRGGRQVEVPEAGRFRMSSWVLGKKKIQERG